MINSFRLVDHIVVMTKGGPDNATSLLLFYIYEVGFKFWDTGYAAALTLVLLVILAAFARGAVPVPRPPGALPVRRLRDGRGGLAPRRRSGSCRWPTRSGRPSIRREFSTRFVLGAPLTLENFAKAWDAAPFARYFVNTVLLVTMILAAQLVLCTLAAYAFARFEFAGARSPSCSCWCSS